MPSRKRTRDRTPGTAKFSFRFRRKRSSRASIERSTPGRFSGTAERFRSRRSRQVCDFFCTSARATSGQRYFATANTFLSTWAATRPFLPTSRPSCARATTSLSYRSGMTWKSVSSRAASRARSAAASGTPRRAASGRPSGASGFRTTTSRPSGIHPTSSRTSCSIRCRRSSPPGPSSGSRCMGKPLQKVRRTKRASVRWTFRRKTFASGRRNRPRSTM